MPSHKKKSSTLQLKADSLTVPPICFLSTKGEEVKDSEGKTKCGAYQNIIDLHPIKCTNQGMDNGTHIPLHEMWGGRLVNGDSIYSCVQNDGKIISGLTNYTWATAKQLPCKENKSTLKQIHLVHHDHDDHHDGSVDQGFRDQP